MKNEFNVFNFRYFMTHYLNEQNRWLCKKHDSDNCWACNPYKNSPNAFNELMALFKSWEK